jgi:hypothetical protein
MYTAFLNENGVGDEILGTIPAIFAKSSMLWPSLLYIMTNNNVKKRIFKIKSEKKTNHPARKSIKYNVSNEACKE